MSIHVPTSEVERVMEHSQSVCKLDGAIHATGTLITPNIILTCSHAIPDRETAEKTTVFFRGRRAKLNLDRVSGGGFYTSPRLPNGHFDEDHLDFTVVGVKWENPQDIPPSIPLPSEGSPLPRESDRLYEIHYPIAVPTQNGEHELSNGESTFSSGQQSQSPIPSIYKGDRPHLIYYEHIKTASGSSGAPIFNRGELVALHHGVHGSQPNRRLGIIAREIHACLIKNGIDFKGQKLALMRTKLHEQAVKNSKLSFFFARQLGLSISVDDLYLPLELNDSSDQRSLNPSEIFSHPSLQGLESQKVLIIGDSGCGKTTFCHKFALENDLVFYLPLKRIKQPQSALEVLRKHCYKETNLDSVLEDPDILKKSTLILDGFDEADNELISSEGEFYQVWEELLTLFPRCIITSRNRSLWFNPDLCLHLNRFRPDQVDGYVTKFFQKMTNPSRKEHVEAIFTKFPDLRQDLARTPIFLEILCVLAHDDPNSIPTEKITWTGLYAVMIHWMCFRFCKQDSTIHLTNISRKDATKEGKVNALLCMLGDLAWQEQTEDKDSHPITVFNALKVKYGIEINESNRLGLLRIDDETCSFAHRSVMEFLSGRRLARSFASNKGTEELAKVKFLSQFFPVIKLVAGYLAYQKKDKALKNFLDALLEPPHDLGGQYIQILLMLALKEADPEKFASQEPLKDEIERRLSENDFYRQVPINNSFNRSFYKCTGRDVLKEVFKILSRSPTIPSFYREVFELGAENPDSCDDLMRNFFLSQPENSNYYYSNQEELRKKTGLELYIELMKALLQGRGKSDPARFNDSDKKDDPTTARFRNLNKVLKRMIEFGERTLESKKDEQDPLNTFDYITDRVLEINPRLMRKTFEENVDHLLAYPNDPDDYSSLISASLLIGRNSLDFSDMQRDKIGKAFILVSRHLEYPLYLDQNELYVVMPLSRKSQLILERVQLSEISRWNQELEEQRLNSIRSNANNNTDNPPQFPIDNIEKEAPVTEEPLPFQQLRPSKAKTPSNQLEDWERILNETDIPVVDDSDDDDDS